MNSKYLTESARISDAYAQMYAKKTVNESSAAKPDAQKKQMNESVEGNSFNAALKSGDLPTEGKGSSKTCSKLGRRPMLPFEKRDAKNTCGHRIPVKKNRQFEKVSGNAKTCALNGNCEIGSAKTGSKLGVRKMVDFKKRDEQPTAIGKIANVKDVGCVKGIKESEDDFEMDVIDTDAGTDIGVETDVEKDGCDGCCEDCKEVLELVKDTIEQIYDNLSDDDKALVDEVKDKIDGHLGEDKKEDDTDDSEKDDSTDNKEEEKDSGDTELPSEEELDPEIEESVNESYVNEAWPAVVLTLIPWAVKLLSKFGLKVLPKIIKIAGPAWSAMKAHPLIASWIGYDIGNSISDVIKSKKDSDKTDAPKSTKEQPKPTAAPVTPKSFAGASQDNTDAEEQTVNLKGVETKLNDNKGNVGTSDVKNIDKKTDKKDDEEDDSLIGKTKGAIGSVTGGLGSAASNIIGGVTGAATDLLKMPFDMIGNFTGSGKKTK